MSRPRTIQRSSMLAPVAAAAAAGALLLAVVLRDPHSGGSWAQCPTLWLTDLACPGCGSLRALHDFGTGDFASGAHHNPLLVPALCWLGWAWLAWTGRFYGVSLPAAPSGRLFCWGLLVTIAAYTVMRNVPGVALGP